VTGPLRRGRPRPYTARVMRTRRLLAALAGIAALGAAAPAAAPAQEAVGVGSHLACVAPGDAAGIDAVLAAAGSPLAGEGATFVREGRAAGIDPRFLVAIAAHETLLQTYGPADAIRNAFGLGPGWSFASERDAIARAARTLAAYYLAEGRVTVGAIGAKWAPIGAANDPTGLNRHWEAGVGTYYAALGGDPSQPVLADAQEELPGCAGAPAAVPAEEGPPVVTAWGGTPPRGAGAGMAEGGDPRTGGPATLAGFVFPLALPVGAPASYRDAFLDPGPAACAGGGRQCAVTISSAPGRHVVAAVAGTLRIASPAELEEGIGFWIETGDGDRVGYGPLPAYAPGISQGVAVTPGRPLGVGSGGLRFAWERDGARVNPHPLLEATRPSA
jgi:hypothetical protein